jgi:transposase
MKTINQIAQEHDVHPMQVRQWKRDIQDQAKTLFEGAARASASFCGEFA